MSTVNDFLVYTPLGLYCEAGGFYLDPKRAVDKAIVSHAHGDHATPNSGSIYTSPSTRQIMNKRFKNSLRSGFLDVNYRECFMMNDVAVTFFPAGHILGSAQVLMEYAGEKYLYTGDFKLQEDESCEPVEFIKTDYLITETTFAHPDHVHPDPVDEINKLNELGDQNVLLGAYAVGKAQRLTRLISRHCPSRKILVHHQVSKFHEVYRQAGVDLGDWSHYSRREFRRDSNCIYILPPNWFYRNSEKELYKIFATGWKHTISKCDALLHISDHADWNGLLKMIEMTEPKKIFTLHGNGAHLKEHFKGRMEVHVLN